MCLQAPQLRTPQERANGAPTCTKASLGIYQARGQMHGKKYQNGNQYAYWPQITAARDVFERSR